MAKILLYLSQTKVIWFRLRAGRTLTSNKYIYICQQPCLSKEENEQPVDIYIHFDPMTCRKNIAKYDKNL